MKIIIFTYDRYDTITTSKYFAGIKHTILCHSEEAKQKYLKAGNIYGDIISSNRGGGLSNNRNYALDLLEDGEWALFMVDDLINVSLLDTYFIEQNNKLNIDFDNQGTYRKKFKFNCDAHRFLNVCNDTIKHAEEKNYNLCGFSLTNNPTWRGKKYTYRSLADGRCWLVKKSDLKQDINVNCIEDYAFTALNLKKFGGIVINNWLLPECKRYGEGGYGSIEKRMKQKIKECKYLTETYPEYLAYAPKKGLPENAHIRVRQLKTINIKQQSLF